MQILSIKKFNINHWVISYLPSQGTWSHSVDKKMFAGVHLGARAGCTLIRLQALGTGRYPLPSLARGRKKYDITKRSYGTYNASFD
jgi:hypothetical protein